MKDLIKKVDYFSMPNKSKAKGKVWVLTGNLRGQFFEVFENTRITIGRDPSCDISVIDQKVSRIHAELVFLNGALIVTDLKSHNGILVDDRKLMQGEFLPQSRLIIGQTIFRFEKTIIKKAHSVQREYIESGTEKFQKYRLPVLFIIFLAVYFFSEIFEVKETQVTNISNKKTIGRVPSRVSTKNIGQVEELKRRSLIAKIKKNQGKRDRISSMSIQNFISKGLRELREKNFFRALSEFNRALDVDPSHTQANYYRRKTLELLDSTISEYDIHARRDIASIKYKSALVSYCAIIRILDSYPEDERYKNTVLKIKEIQGEMGYDDGEIQCFKR